MVGILRKRRKEEMGVAREQVTEYVTTGNVCDVVRCGWGGCSMDAGSTCCRKWEWQCRQWCGVAEHSTGKSEQQQDSVLGVQPIDRAINEATRRRMRQARTGLQESVQQLHLDAWKG